MYFLLDTATMSTGSALLQTAVPFVLVFGAMYFMLIRPQKKRDKQLQDMRSSLEIGDNVTTAGGIVGRVVAIKEDTVVLETGTERAKIRFKRWAVSDVEKLKVD